MVDIGTILTQWQSAGVYEFVLPFLLVFAIVFGILTTTNILGKHKGIHVIIAVIVGLMAVGYSSSIGYSLGQFLQTLFPRLGIGLAVILSILVLVGLFVPEHERGYWMWGLGAIGAVIAIVIVTQTFDALSFFSFSSYSDYLGWIIGGVLIVGLIIAVATASGDKKSDKEPRIAVVGDWTKK